MSGEQEHLLNTLINQIGKLTTSVDDLVRIDAARMERERHQEEKNDKFDNHIEHYRPSLDRLVNWHQTLDKVKVPLIFAFILIFGTLAGINWKS